MDIKSILAGIKLTKNFSALEFANTLDGYAIALPSHELALKMQSVRDRFGGVEITSGYRTIAYNKRVGGSEISYHLDGLAVDCRFNYGKSTKGELVEIFKKIGFTNVGFYQNKDGSFDRFHLDIGKARVGSFYVFTKKV